MGVKVVQGLTVSAPRCSMVAVPAVTFDNVERWLKELRDHAGGALCEP